MLNIIILPINIYVLLEYILSQPLRKAFLNAQELGSGIAIRHNGVSGASRGAGASRVACAKTGIGEKRGPSSENSWTSTNELTYSSVNLNYIIMPCN